MDFPKVPGRLRRTVDGLAPPDQLDEDRGHRVGNWVSRESPACDEAAPEAERYVHDCLDQAWRAGHELGIGTCRWVWWPLLGLCLVLSAVVLALM